MVKPIESWEAADGTLHQTRELADYHEFEIVLMKLMNVSHQTLNREQVKRLWLRRFELAGFIHGTHKLSEKVEVVKNDQP